MVHQFYFFQCVDTLINESTHFVHTRIRTFTQLLQHLEVSHRHLLYILCINPLQADALQQNHQPFIFNPNHFFIYFFYLFLSLRPTYFSYTIKNKLLRINPSKPVQYKIKKNRQATANSMEINDLHIEKYIKVANISQLVNPELLSTLCIIDKREYFRNIHAFETYDENSNRYQLYVSRVPPRSKILDDVVFIKNTPKLLFLKGDVESLVLEEKIHDRLSDYQIFYETQQSPYFPEVEARNIMMDISESAQDFLKHQINYDCISPKNVVRMDERWYLSSVGLIFGVDKDLPEYTPAHFDSDEKKLVYSWAALLFKLVFGFCPFQSGSAVKPPRQFKFKEYLTYLEKQQSKTTFLKIYYFGFRVLQLSPKCLNLLELGLSGKLDVQAWREHDYFVTPLRHESSINQKNREMKMVNSVQSSQYSLMMAAIEHRKKYSLQKLNQKPNSSPEEPTYSEILEHYRKNYLLKNLRFVAGFEKKENVIASEKTESVLPTLINDYFYEDCFDPEEDYPCRELLKLIQREKQENPKLYENGKREAELKLYAYPYAVAFELCKVQNQQPAQLKRKIKKAIELLLQLSALYYPGNIKPLHNSLTKYKQFTEMKTVYREHINELYRYFLNQAMRKYNSKADTASIIERMKKKEKGLEYYRLCLKLLEASLIVRKGGKDLDLARIQTSQRKEIEQDLEQLLKSYFPNKAHIH